MREGLRVIEETARFELNNRQIAEDIKTLRHSYGDLKALAPGIIEARDSSNDIGRNSDYDKQKKNLKEIIGSAFGRSQEAARVLEEFGLYISPDFTCRAKEIRFKLYDIEKDMTTALRKAHLTFPESIGLYLVMTSPRKGYEKLTEIAVKNSVGAVQLRDKTMNDRQLLETARRMREITAETDTLFFVNDRIDIAVLSDADGVHVGQSDIDVSECRSVMGSKLVGKSTHNLKQLRNALKERPDYIGIGPVFPTNSKAVPDPVLGLDEAGRMLEAWRFNMASTLSNPISSTRLPLSCTALTRRMNFSLWE
ncbi:MAG: thiamine phosphate synthase, partial [bacterium]